jgi:hypothetical protein
MESIQEDCMDVSTKGYPIKRINSHEYTLKQNMFDPHFSGSPPVNSFMEKLFKREAKHFNTPTSPSIKSTPYSNLPKTLSFDK